MEFSVKSFGTFSQYFQEIPKNSRRRCSVKRGILKNIQRKTPVLESLFNKVLGLFRRASDRLLLNTAEVIVTKILITNATTI